MDSIAILYTKPLYYLQLQFCLLKYVCILSTEIIYSGPRKYLIAKMTT